MSGRATMAGDLLEFMDLCGLRGDSWRPWRTVAKCVEGRPLDRDDQALYERCTQRARVLTEPPGEVWIVKGRRAGGTRFAGCLATQAALQPYPQLAPGEQAVVGLAAADREQARVLFNYAVAPFRERPDLRGLVAPRSGWAALRELIVRETHWSLGLKTGAAVEVHTSHYGHVRGRTFARALASEVNFWAREDGSNPASETITAIKPGLATLNGLLAVESTPHLKDGPHWDTYRRYFGQDDARVLVWQAPTRVMNPLIAESVVQDACERDPEAAKSEWLAEFRDDAGALVTDAALRAVVPPGRGVLEPSSAHRYAMVADNATGSGVDSLAVGVGHLEVRDGVPVAVVDGVAEARPPFNPSEVVAQIATHARAYGCDRVYGDGFAKGWSHAIYGQAGLVYEPLPMTKSELYLAGLALINAKMIELPDEPRLLAQIAGLQRRPGAAGRESVDHKPGSHDDLANVALGVAALLQRGVLAEPVRLW